VQVRTIDEIFQEEKIANVGFMEIYTEGDDCHVLKGAENSLMNGVIKAISFEFGSWNFNSRTYFRDLWSYVSSMNFEL